MAQRVKGQEVRITMVGPDGTEDSIGSGGVLSADVEFLLDILSEGYLGEVSERVDDIFKGVSGRVEGNVDSQSAFRLIEKVVARSQRRSPASTRFNLIMTLSMPNGDRPRVLLTDIAFGGIPVQVGGRDEYVRLSFEFKSSNGRFLF